MQHVSKIILQRKRIKIYPAGISTSTSSKNMQKKLLSCCKFL